MQRLPASIILVAAFVVVYVEATFNLPRRLVGAQVDLLPAFIVCAALTRSLGFVVLMASCGGLWFDSFSANPLGITVLPLLAVGAVIYQLRTLFLRDLPYAQFILGLVASAFVPLAVVVLLLTLDRTPLFGWGSLWQWFVMTITGGLLTPPCFTAFEWLDRVLNYQTAPETSFRADREIERGKT